MDQQSRRRLLAGLAGLTTLAGCNDTGTPTETQEPTATPTDSETAAPTDTSTASETPTPTPTPISADDLEFVAGVVRQPSESAPGRIFASLTNNADRTLGLIGGDPLPVSNGVDDGPDNTLLLYPDQSDTINEYHWEDTDAEGLDAVTYDGCWRAPSGVLARTDLGTGIDLSPGLSVAAEYTPLGLPDADCPEGTYTAAEEVTLRRSEQTLGLELDVTVESDGELATAGRLTLGD